MCWAYVAGVHTARRKPCLPIKVSYLLMSFAPTIWRPRGWLEPSTVWRPGRCLITVNQTIEIVDFDNAADVDTGFQKPNGT